MRTLFTIATFSQLIPVVIGVINFRFIDKNLKVFLFYLFVAVIVGLTSLLLVYFKKENIWMLHIFTIVEFLILSLMYRIWIDDKRFKNVISVFILIFSIGIILIKSFVEQSNKIDNVSLTFESILILVITSMYFIDYSLKNTIIDYFDYKFVITITLMFYFGGNIFVFALSNEINTWPIHVFIGIICQLIYGFVFLWQRFQVKPSG